MGTFLYKNDSSHKLYKANFQVINMAIGRVIQFRRGRTTYTPRHFLIEVPGCENRESATKFVGKAVEWKSPAGKIIKGKIAAAHGNNGVVRAIFEIGLPGQAIGTDVEVKN